MKRVTASIHCLGTVSLVTFDLPHWYNDSDPGLIATIASARHQLSAVVDFAFHANDVDQLIRAFDDVAGVQSWSSSSLLLLLSFFLIFLTA